MNWRWSWFCLMPLALFAGCLEVDQRFTINPDGTAKVRVELAFDLALLERVEAETGMDMQNEAHEAEATMRQLARQCIATAKGVDAWTDYKMTLVPNKEIRVFMTGYIRDLSKFVLLPAESEIPNMVFQRSVTETKHEVWQMSMPGVNDRPEKDDPKAKRLEPDEWEEVLAERRNEFDAESAESRVLFDALKIRSTLRFPGKVVQTVNAKRTSRQEVEVLLEGKRFYEMMEKILADETLARRALRQGGELHGSLDLPGDQINAWLFGERAPVTVHVAPGERALFDYEKELARAKANPSPAFPEDE